jgi:hypothetical protein
LTEILNDASVTSPKFFANSSKQIEQIEAQSLTAKVWHSMPAELSKNLNNAGTDLSEEP